MSTGQAETQRYSSGVVSRSVILKVLPAEWAAELDLQCEFRQTHDEGVMVDWRQEAFEQNAAVIINPAGLSFHSIPVLDALKRIKAPLIELPLFNIHARDELHRHSIRSGVANAVICGLGAEGYPLAVRAVAQLLKRVTQHGQANAGIA